MDENLQRCLFKLKQICITGRRSAVLACWDREHPHFYVDCVTAKVNVMLHQFELDKHSDLQWFKYIGKAFVFVTQLSQEALIYS